MLPSRCGLLLRLLSAYKSWLREASHRAGGAGHLRWARSAGAHWQQEVSGRAAWELDCSFATQGAESVCELSAGAVLVLERGDKCKNRKIVISREGRHISE